MTVHDIKHFPREELVSIKNFLTVRVAPSGCKTVFIQIDDIVGRSYKQRSMLNVYSKEDILRAMKLRLEGRKLSHTILRAYGRLREHLNES